MPPRDMLYAGFATVLPTAPVQVAPAMVGIAATKINPFPRQSNFQFSLSHLYGFPPWYKIDNLAARRKIGSTLKYPKWALAYKFADPIFTTTLLDITYKIGSTGRVTPLRIVTGKQIGRAHV